MNRKLIGATVLVLILSLLVGAEGVLAQAPPPPPVWHAPVLTWAGTSGYVAKGVVPVSGVPGTTFTFKVMYKHQDNTPPQYVRLQLWNPIGGVVQGSPFAMVGDGTTNWISGAIFSVSMPLKKIGNYSYRFITSDGGAIAQFPSTRVTGPLVNTPPKLAWTGEPGYTTDGVAPNTAPTGSTFNFRIKYTDPDGPAQSVSLQIWGPDGVEIAGSPFAMSSTAATPNWASGVIFAQSMPLSAVGTYQYRFAASDGFAFVYLPSATGRVNGPKVTDAPTALLAWAGIAGFLNDGVAPNTAPVGSTFNFKVKCSTSDGSVVPVYLEVWRPDGHAVVGSPFTMTVISGMDWAAGVILQKSLVLSAAGTFQYRFSTGGGATPAALPAAGWASGPTTTKTASPTAAEPAAAPEE
jgi:hypothetical protein